MRINNDYSLPSSEEHKEVSREGFNRLELLQSRETMYKFLGYVFYNKLNSESLKNIKISTFLLLLTTLQAEEKIPGIAELKDSFSYFANDEGIKLLQQDYQALFEGPGKLLAPPWESFYLSPEKLVFEVQTMEVREFYKKNGLQINNFAKEPEDHIGLELQFMAELAAKSVQSWDNKTMPDYNLLIAEQVNFLENHLLKWTELFGQMVQIGAATFFYKGLGSFLPWYLDNDHDLISSLMLTE